MVYHRPNTILVSSTGKGLDLDHHTLVCLLRWKILAPWSQGENLCFQSDKSKTLLRHRVIFSECPINNSTRRHVIDSSTIYWKPECRRFLDWSLYPHAWSLTWGEIPLAFFGLTCPQLFSPASESKFLSSRHICRFEWINSATYPNCTSGAGFPWWSSRQTRRLKWNPGRNGIHLTDFDVNEYRSFPGPSFLVECSFSCS